MARLVKRARAARIPVIYANDNFGRWRSNFQDVISHCLNDGVRGEPVARMLLPDADDYFVLKPKHSAFFSTMLDTLLKYLCVRRLILAGLTSESCVLLTAADAHMRDFEVW